MAHIVAETKKDAQEQRRDAVQCSPRGIAMKIEGCIVRNAWDEERRAQKALFLLKTRDRRIAFLEKRVAQLEDVAADIHQVSLRSSSRVSTLQGDKEAATDLTRSEKSSRTGDETDDTAMDSFDKKVDEDCPTSPENRVSVPSLKLSKSSTSNSEMDIFSTPAMDLILERRKYLATNERVSNRDQILEKVTKPEKLAENIVGSKSESKLKTVNNQRAFDVDKNDAAEGQGGQVACWGNVEEKGGASVTVRKCDGHKSNKQQRAKLPRTSSSVPWIRAKHSLRKKLRGFELKTGRGAGELPAGDGHLTFAAFGPIEAGPSLDRLSGGREIVDDAAKRKRSTVAGEQDKALNGQEARFIAVEKLDTETKTTFTQTSTTATQSEEKTTKVSEARTKVNHASTSCTHLELKKSSTFWNIDEDPAPQWLIEEALNRETQRSERWTKDETTLNKESEYEAIISELEVKLSETKEDLEEALRTKSIVKEKYKRSLENVKLEARKENEILQDRIVRICTSVLENFGPRAISEKAGQNYQYKCRGLVRGRKKISSKLHKKLRVAVARSNKLKRELATARMALKSKSERYESISKCFDKLKLEMEATEGNLNNLISENLALQKRMEDTREWMEQNAGKEQREKSNAVHFKDIQRSRELAGLKKKAEEDAATITQLRNKLLRSESANANKGFLLSSYKSQLADLNKEKNQRVSKINCLENEISAARNSNSQLKAKISVLTKEKDKLLTDNGKSEADIREKMETQRAKNWEELMQGEVDTIKAKYEETVKSMKVKMIAAESQNMEYSKAIKEFLKKLYEYRIDHESEKSSNGDEASEKEAHKTACNILNMTPEELSGFINGKVPNSVSSWMGELGRIISRNNFSEGLSKFLFKKTTKMTKM